MDSLKTLTIRNMKVYFKDKGLFFSSLITPLILLLLFVTFLREVYVESFTSSLAHASVTIDKSIIDAIVGGELLSSLIAVSAVTISFCSNLIMVQDKALGSIKDLLITPVKRWKIYVAYFLGTFLCSLTILLIAAAIGFIYLAVVGWYLSIADVILIIVDIIVLTLFGTAFGCFVNSFLKTQGQMSAVGTLVSSVYGFISGAYLPIASFSEGIRNAVSFLPGNYGTVLIKNHYMRGGMAQLEGLFPSEVIQNMKDSVDMNFYFFNNLVPQWTLWTIILTTVVVLSAGYVLVSVLKDKKQ